MDALVAATNIITATVFLVVSIPVFLWLKERAIPQVHSAAELKVAMTQDQDKGKTAETLMNFIDFRYLVVCVFFYQCGVATVITLAAVYASAVMGFGLTETLFMVLLVNITAALGAFGFGYVQDRIGHKSALALTLLLWIASARGCVCPRKETCPLLRDLEYGVVALGCDRSHHIWCRDLDDGEQSKARHCRDGAFLCCRAHCADSG